jgi:hypothetical protein
MAIDYRGATSPIDRSLMEHKPDLMDYTGPEITDYGDLTELTAGTSRGNYLDAAFPAGTPRGDLSFSVSP